MAIFLALMILTLVAVLLGACVVIVLRYRRQANHVPPIDWVEFDHRREAFFGNIKG